jgi:hypothetical protein
MKAVQKLKLLCCKCNGAYEVILNPEIVSEFIFLKCPYCGNEKQIIIK